MGFFGELYLRSTRPFLAPEATAREAAFIARELGASERVLDIGCGHGRHLALLTAAGRDCWGVDLDALSLSAVPAALKPRVVRGDLYRLPFRAAFDAAYAWYATLFISRDEAHNRAALAEAVSVLRPGGVLLVHGHNPLEQAREPQTHFDAVLADGAKLTERTWYEPEANVLHGHRRLEHAGRVLEGEFLVRCPTADDHARWASELGLKLEALFGDDAGGRYRPGSPDLIAKLRRA